MAINIINPYRICGELSLRHSPCFVIMGCNAVVLSRTNTRLSLFFSAVFSLPEGKMLSFFGIVPSGHFLDIPNGILGMMFYSYILLRHITSPPLSPGPLSGLFLPQSNFIISSLAFASSLFLGRKLYLIKEICVLCLTTHILNTTLFYRAATEIFSKSKAGKHD